jgi:hypothetical protein
MNISKSNNEDIVRLDLLFNNKILYTTDNFDNLEKSFDIIDNIFKYGLNNLYIRVYYYNNYYIEENVKYIRGSDIAKITAANPNVNTVLNKIIEVFDYTNDVVDSLFDTLVENGYELSENDRKLTNLLYFIRGEGPTALKMIHDMLDAKNIPYSKDDDIKTLVQSLDDYLVYRKYYYKNGMVLVDDFFEYVTLPDYTPGSFTKTESCLVITQAASQAGNFLLSKTIDFTPYNRVYIDLKATSFQGNTTHYLPTLCVFTTKTDQSLPLGYVRSNYTTDRQVVSMDVSSINSSNYIGTSCLGASYEIYSLWFE